MKQSRILPLLGPALVLYLLADVASQTEGLTFGAKAVGAAAFLSTLAPLWLRSLAEVPGARRVGSLGVALGISLVSYADPSLLSLSVDIASAIAHAAVGALLLDLALTVPDRPPALRNLRPALTVGAIVAGGLGVLAALPVFEVFGETVIAPGTFANVPIALAAVGACAALALRFFRGRFGSGPDALASNSWGTLGLLPAVAAGSAVALLPSANILPASSPWVASLAALGALSALYGHVALVDPKRRLHAGRAVRRAIATALTMTLVGMGVAGLADRVPTEPVALAVAASVTLVLGTFLARLVAPIVRRILAPYGGRLLDAIDDAQEAVAGSPDLGAVAAAVLPALRRASGSLSTEPLLYTTEPARELRIDAAGQPHSRAVAMPAAIQARLVDNPGEVLVRSAFETRVVRRPDLRELVEALASIDALCVAPLAVRGELEGILVVPQGSRDAALSLEELAAVEELGRRVAGWVSLVSAQARAQGRATVVSSERDRADERVDALEEELERLRTEAVVLRAGRGAGRAVAPPVAYSAAMRALDKRIVDIAPLPSPVLVVAEPGTPVDRVARRIHGASGRAEGPFVVADCAALRPEASAAALFGSEGERPHPGWLRSAHGGTLLLADVPALSAEAQRWLAEALAVRQGRAVGGAGAYPVDVRIVATSRLPLASLSESGLFEPELARWLSRTELVAPALRERREDLPSLVLLALDRACRVLGREPVGIEQAAVDALAAHDWPGNLRELQHVIDRAVAATEGTQVTAGALPTLAVEEPTPVVEDPLAGTYAELERKVLSRAMERAGGNKSEAARLLGLKRTTFLDKLRRHDLNDGPGKPAVGAA